MKNRNYCFTSFQTDFAPNTGSPDLQYMIYQQEKCPETGKLHGQGYIELCKAMRMNAVKTILRDEKVHLELRKGTQAEAIAYCRKSDTRQGDPVEGGSPASQGKRSDLSVIAKMERSAIIEQFPEMYIKYHSGIDKLQAYRSSKEQKLRLDMKVYILWGEAGTGKTRYVYDRHAFNDIYKLNTNSNGTLWWDGYDNQSVLLIDDFGGWIKYSELLTILDVYPYRCQIKGSYCYANWSIVYITSNNPMIKGYPSIMDNMNISALKRRITDTIFFSAPIV